MPGLMQKPFFSGLVHSRSPFAGQHETRKFDPLFHKQLPQRVHEAPKRFRRNGFGAMTQSLGENGCGHQHDAGADTGPCTQGQGEGEKHGAGQEHRHRHDVREQVDARAV